MADIEQLEGTKVLDMGCGAGRFCRIAADRGANISGLDATATFVQIARKRIPAGDFRVGDIEHLPWPDNSFDVVTGFNSFIFAADFAGALREAGRVARSAASVAITVFGRPEKCESTNVFGSVGQLLPAQAEAGDSERGGLTCPMSPFTSARARFFRRFGAERRGGWGGTSLVVVE
jgi:ubiquinone/menaquinone biosynthesis C-methylase UbiE